MSCRREKRERERERERRSNGELITVLTWIRKKPFSRRKGRVGSIRFFVSGVAKVALNQFSVNIRG